MNSYRKKRCTSTRGTRTQRPFIGASMFFYAEMHEPPARISRRRDLKEGRSRSGVWPGQSMENRRAAGANEAPFSEWASRAAEALLSVFHSRARARARTVLYSILLAPYSLCCVARIESVSV